MLKSTAQEYNKLDRSTQLKWTSYFRSYSASRPQTCYAITALGGAMQAHRVNWNLLAFLVTLTARTYSLYRRFRKVSTSFVPPAVQAKLDEIAANAKMSTNPASQEIIQTTIMPAKATTTAATGAVTRKDSSMKFLSILSGIGKTLEKVFGVATTIAKDAEPLVSFAFPGIGPLYAATVNAVANAETASIAAGKQSGSGPQKLAAVVAAIEKDFNAYASVAGMSSPKIETIESWVNAVVATLNAIPASAAQEATT